MAKRPRLKKRQLQAIIGLIVMLAVYICQQQGWFGNFLEQDQPGMYRITRYVDGDTIVVNMNGSDETIRFIGIDTPETHKPNTPVQCYGPAAAAHTKNLLQANGGKVRLAADPLGTNRDRYNRLLRYVYTPDGQLVNEVNIREGYAFYYPYFPFTKSQQFAAAQSQAQSTSKGLWGNCQPIRTDKGGYTMPSA